MERFTLIEVSEINFFPRVMKLESKMHCLFQFFIDSFKFLNRFREALNSLVNKYGKYLSAVKSDEYVDVN